MLRLNIQAFLYHSTDVLPRLASGKIDYKPCKSRGARKKRLAKNEKEWPDKIRRKRLKNPIGNAELSMPYTLDTVLQSSPFALDEAEKSVFLRNALNQLTQHHLSACEPYRRMISAFYPSGQAASQRRWRRSRFYRSASSRRCP